jgi:hypothetical protein
MTPQPGTAGTDDDPLDAIETTELVVNGEVIDTLVGLAFDSANATDGVLRFDGTGSTNGITDGSAKVIVNGTVYNVAGGEWVDFSGTSHSLDSWEKVVNSQFDVTITSTTSPVDPGNTLDVTADVTNNGTDSDTQTVTLSIDNSVGQADSANVTLSGGGSTTQTLSWAVPSGQTKQDYTATVSSADDTASQTVTVGPPNSANLQHHYDATTISGSDGDSIGTWSDQKQNDDLTQSASSDQPTLRTGSNGINNTQVLEAGGSEVMDVGWTQIGQPLTVYLVVKVGSAQSSAGNPFAMNTLTATSSSPQMQLFRGGSDDLIFAGSNLRGQSSTTTAHIYTIVFDSGSSLIRRDGADDVSGNAGSLNDAGLIVFGNRGGPNLDSKIGEILVYGAAHSTSTQQQVESYLDATWGVLP